MNAQYCPECGTPNTVNSRFCQSCGASLAGTSVSQTQAQTEVTVSSTAPRQHARSTPSYPEERIGQIGTGGLSVADIWGPFAGYGERGRHVSWLLDNLGDRAEDLREAVINRFRDRQIPRAQVQPRTLTGKGIAVERRPYYLVRRGITTAGLYIARFGRDLYISQVTYAKGPINPLRVAILGVMVLFQVYISLGYSQSLQSAILSLNPLGVYRGDSGSLGFLLCCVGPLGALNTLGLSLVGLHMVYKTLTDKNSLAVLRTPPNEFQRDDIVALEKAVEETVRQALDTIGLDSSLMPPASEYGFEERII
jgi:hypothetical protein